ncbi:MAG: M48 family metallopeptidase [Polyangiaceae bacterium]|nr:M48 family metallopeptidase [Polyangiaceae bacterium]
MYLEGPRPDPSVSPALDARPDASASPALDARPDASASPALDVTYFDGKNARAFAARLRLEAGELALEGEGLRRRDALASVELSAPVGSAPGRLSYADGASCELPVSAEAQRFWHAVSPPPLVARLESKLRYGLGLLLASALLLAFGYRFGLPTLARVVAFSVPESALDATARDALAVLDGSLLSPSKLEPERQQRLLARFEALTPPGGVRAAHHIEFRAAPSIGANAFALPSGTIIVTDGLAELVDDDELVAVMGHELGHVRHRHTLRQFLQSSVVGLLGGWFIGDFSGVLAGVPTALLEASYSREFEAEADHYAAEMLLANGASPAWLATALEKLGQSHGVKVGAEHKDYFASHPGIGERAAQMRALAPSAPSTR